MNKLRRVLAVAFAATLAACAAPGERYARRATALGMTTLLLQGEGFDHRSFTAGSGGATLHVYIEHDGTPWEQADRVAADPTPRIPYALELMAQDGAPRLMLGRPCYFQEQARPPCSARLWTHERYGPAVVASMVAALRRYLDAHGFRRVVLIGYSGGGTLAWLMAGRVPETVALVTFAANLDIDAWARAHGYSALAGSLNPAALPSLSSAIVERHYVGARDSNVSPASVRAFAQRHPRATMVEMAGFDHSCCWSELLAPALRVVDGR